MNFFIHCRETKDAYRFPFRKPFAFGEDENTERQAPSWATMLPLEVLTESLDAISHLNMSLC